MAPSWVRLTLDVDSFDDRAFDRAVDRCSKEGIALRTMTELGDHEANHRRLYELNRTCSADIPGRGAFYTFDEYCAWLLGGPATPPTKPPPDYPPKSLSALTILPPYIYEERALQ